MVQDKMEELRRVPKLQEFVGEFYFYLESSVESLKCPSVTHSDTHFLKIILAIVCYCTGAPIEILLQNLH